MSTPVCTIIAGPNGAGKTTFAGGYLRGIPGGEHFLNADTIAAGLSTHPNERDHFAAGRIFLREIQRHLRHRKSFAFETTLSGRSYLHMIRKMVADDWQVDLFYLWIPDIGRCADRVAERVAHGGHDIPLEDLARRYPRSISNLVNYYAPICTHVVCFDNSSAYPQQIFRQDSNGREILNPLLFEALKKGQVP